MPTIECVYGNCACQDISRILVNRVAAGWHNGCGPRMTDTIVRSLGSWAARRLSQGGTFDFNPACNAHDICYSRCGVNKNSCDAQLARAIKRICLQASADIDMENETRQPDVNQGFFARHWGNAKRAVSTWASKKKCDVNASLISRGVVTAGGSVFNDAQGRHCQCETVASMLDLERSSGRQFLVRRQ